jgi:predicted XRE-type DNA-binding protein
MAKFSNCGHVKPISSTHPKSSFDELVDRTTTKKTKAKASRRAQELLEELLLSEIRQLAGKSQQEIAETLGMKQPSLSKLEKQADMQISTLRKIVEALGGKLEILARFPKGTVKIDQFDPSQRRSRRQGPGELQLV